jgi:hypothetical protein
MRDNKEAASALAAAEGGSMTLSLSVAKGEKKDCWRDATVFEQRAAVGGCGWNPSVQV